MSSLQLLLALGALWVWLGFNLSNLRDRYSPGTSDWVILVFWFMLAIIPIAFIAWTTRPF